jgi:alanine dehydrogenase
MESGDLLMAFDDRDWASPKLVELQEIVSGRVHARTRTDEITLFKSNGLAVEDVIAAAFVYERALASGRGRAVASAHS